MQFMVIESFRGQDAASVYQRLRERGRMMTDGLIFLHSWVSADLGRCFQVVECDEITQIQRWVAQWTDLVEFEVVPVTSGHATAALFDPSHAPGEP